MKAIMISIQPQYVADILNGKKTIEIRKRFPKDYVGWVYIYCCKQKKNEIGCHINYEKVDGKVVARFWCDKVEEIAYDYGGLYEMFQTGELDCDMLNVGSRLTDNELKQYLKPKREHGNICGYAIHITNLEIFDKPKEISEFYKFGYGNIKPQGSLRDRVVANYFDAIKYKLTSAPQSWCYVEV